MAVLVEANSVIVRLAAVREAYPAGLDDFMRHVPNATVCTDEHLARVGFMAQDDLRAFVHLLQADGLRHLEGGRARDLAVADQRDGLLDPAPWLVVEEMEVPGGRVRACWLAGEPPGPLSVPEDWRFERSLSREHGFAPTVAFHERMSFVRREAERDVYVDRETGREAFVVRARPLEPTIAQLDALYARLEATHRELYAASEEIDRALHAGDVVTARDLRAGLETRHHAGLGALADGVGRHVWQVHHQLGFLLRVLDRLSEAEAPLRDAHRLEPGALSVLHELVLVLGEQEAHDEALPFARQAVSMAPTSVVSRTNLAACLLGVGDLAAARAEVEEALRRDPDDATGRYILEVVDEAERFGSTRARVGPALN